jgi:hypothetical protein
MPRPSWRLALICLAGVLLATAVALLAGQQTASAPINAVSGSPIAATIPSQTAPVAIAGDAGSGKQADWVVSENQQPGTNNWRINGTPATGSITGFADQTYATVGQPVKLYVSTTASRFHVEAYRIGYYGGLGGRLVWASPDYDGQQQPACPLTAGINMVACDNWSSTMTVQITQQFIQGDYLFKLVGSDNEQSYVPLTVWDPDSHATYLVKNGVFTWQAWNTYGGYNYYQGVGTCPAAKFPPCARARIVSYDRPYATGQGAGYFLSMEAPLVRFAEEHGLDVTYVTDLTVQDHPSILRDHTTLLSLGHDDCWSLGERTAVTDAHQAGLNIAFFGAGAVLRHVRTQDSPIGPDRELVDYRSANEDPLNGHGNPRDVTSNTWGSAPASWPSASLVGQPYNGFLPPNVREPMTVVDPSAWIFAGADLTNGSIPDAISSDVDSLEAGTAHPASVQILAHSTLPAAGAQATSRNGPVFYSDMTYYTVKTGHAGVWDSGTNNWIPAMVLCTAGPPCPAAAVDKITGNLLALLGRGPAGNFQPSVPNTKTYSP